MQYCFKCEKCGSTVEVTRTISERDKAQKCKCKTKMIRDYQAEFCGTPHIAGNWPMYSDAVGVHPAQVQEAIQESIRLGVPTNYNSEGQAEWTSQSHRKRHCEALGYYDRNAGYGDPTPKHR